MTVSALDDRPRLAHAVTDDAPRDVYVHLRSDLLVIGDSIVTDRHHASATNYEPDDPQNQIGGVVPSFSLSGWLRHGMEAVVLRHGGTACHPGEPEGNYVKAAAYDRDLEAGYHEKGACVDDPETDAGCLLFDLFGGFGGVPGKVMRRPIRFSPVRSAVDYSRGQAEGHYRRVSRNVVTRNDADGRTPLRHTELDAIGNFDGCWHLRFREPKPEFIGLLVAAIDFLDANRMELMHQLGGARNFGAGIVDAAVINPQYDDAELRRYFDRAKQPTDPMAAKDEAWMSEQRPDYNDALRERVDEDGS